MNKKEKDKEGKRTKFSNNDGNNNEIIKTFEQSEVDNTSPSCNENLSSMNCETELHQCELEIVKLTKKLEDLRNKKKGLVASKISLMNAFSQQQASKQDIISNLSPMKGDNISIYFALIILMFIL